MSYTNPCQGDCGNSHWPDCDKNCSSKKPVTLTTKQQQKIKEEIQKRKEGKKICRNKGHDWEYIFIVYQCKRCGETSEY